MTVNVNYFPCDCCGRFAITGNDLCTCTPLRDPAVLDLMERVVAARHRDSVKLAASHAPRVRKAA